MKTRASFVANSSSSSFLVAYRSLDCIGENIEPKWAKDLITNSIIPHLRDRNQITTVEELDAFCVEEYGFDDDEYTIENILADNQFLREQKYPLAKSAVEQGYIVADVSIDWNNPNAILFTGLPSLDFTEPITLLKAYC